MRSAASRTICDPVEFGAPAELNVATFVIRRATAEPQVYVGVVRFVPRAARS